MRIGTGVTRRQAIAGMVGLVAIPTVATVVAKATRADDKSVADHDDAGFRRDLIGVHPRLILGIAVSLEELKRRGKDAAYSNFVTELFVEANRRKGQPPPPNDFQRVWWTLPNLAVAYHLSGDVGYRDTLRTWVLGLTDQLSYPDWGGEHGGAFDNAMGLMGIGLAYDWLYQAFDDSERARIRSKLALQANKLYNSYYLTSDAVEGYWKNDYQNNHHHIRLGGLMLATAAIYGDGADPGGESEPARLDFAGTQLEEILNWISPDGSQHEGPTYFAYGNEHIVRAIHVYECVTGRRLWNERVHQMGTFKIHESLPGLQRQAAYADGDGSLYYFNHFLWKVASHFHDGVLQGFLQDLYDSSATAHGSFIYNAWNLLWFDQKLSKLPVDGLPTVRYFPDLELATIRSGWDAGAVTLHFKCGPPGGHRLNQWRDRLAPNNSYVNVAHDHPDAGHFTLSFAGYVWGNYGGYERQRTKYHNTIVAGPADIGQAGEFDFGFFQPYADMRDRANIQDVFGAGDDAVAIGEASRAYQAPSAAGLTRFNRHLVFVGGHYAVVVDDVASASAQDITFLFHSSGTFTGSQRAGWVITQRPLAPPPAPTPPPPIPSWPASLELYLASSTAGATASAGTDFLPPLGTLWRLRAPHAATTQFVAVLFPQLNGESLQGAPPVVAQDGQGTKVMVTHADGRVDWLGVVTGAVTSGPITLESGDPKRSASGIGRLLLTTGDPERGLVSALLAEGSRLRVPAFQLQLQPSETINLRYQAESRASFTLAAGLPPSARAVTVQLGFSGLPAGQRYELSVGGSHRSIRADAEGALQVGAPLAQGATLQLGFRADE